MRFKLSRMLVLLVSWAYSINWATGLTRLVEAKCSMPTSSSPARAASGGSDRVGRVGHRGHRRRPLLDGNGLPTFATAQELAAEFSNVLGLPLSTIDADYNPTTKELTYHLIVSHAFDPANVPVGFSLDLSPLSGLTSASEAVLNADGDLEMTLGISLHDLSA